MSSPKKLQFLQKLHYITVVKFKQKFVFLLYFAFEQTCNSLLVHKSVQSII
jgi:hypothetical protein